MKHLGFLFFLLPGFCLTEEVQPPLSLQSAMALALEHNYTLLAQRVAARIPQMDVNRERAEFRWQFTPNFEVRTGDDALSRVGADLHKKLAQGGTLRTTADLEQRDDQSTEYVQVSLSQPLFRRFGRERTERALDDARTRGKAAELELLRFTTSLMIQTVNALSDVQGLRRRIVQEERALVRSHELMRLVGLREKQGRASRVEVMEVQMLHRQVELRLSDVESRYAGARENLASLLGMTDAQLPPVGPLEVPAFTLPSRFDAIGLSMSNRPERALALLRYDDARRHLDLERRKMYPDLRLVTRWHPVDDGGGDTWSIGIAGGQGLDRTRVKIDISLQEQQVEQALLQVAAVELELQRDAANALRRVERAELQLTLNAEQAKLAETRLHVTRRMYDKQRGDVLAVREAENALTNVEQDLLQANIEKLRAQYAFLEAVGLLAGP